MKTDKKNLKSSVTTSKSIRTKARILQKACLIGAQEPYSRTMQRITPEQQLNAELNKLSLQDRENLCIALVCLLRFGLKTPIKELLNI